MGQKTSHNPVFVEEMRQKLLAEKEQLDKELRVLGHKDHGDFQANYPDYGRKEEENADEVADYQARAAATEAAEERFKNVEQALERIETGTYGVTDDGILIPEERLRANPAATTTVKPKE